MGFVAELLIIAIKFHPHQTARIPFFCHNLTVRIFTFLWSIEVSMYEYNLNHAIDRIK